MMGLKRNVFKITKTMSDFFSYVVKNTSYDRIRPPLAIFFAFLKKITMASPAPNGQGYHVQFFASQGQLWNCRIAF